MRKAKVYRNNVFVGLLTEEDSGSFVFKYSDSWLLDKDSPSVSLTLPKRSEEYRLEYLFPFFFNMLSEGANKTLQCTRLKIDPNDNFGLLLATAQYDTLGAITIKPDKE
ncbi:MAG: HipA N-terminal domain-containing protein [Candidatus Delongbacteria bacterium]|jgi:HipA-like protein|nr:HipA N-terminal domain-containing protein [Candidatus Delongbacteria bacterium]